MLGISFDTPKKNAKFAERWRFSFRLLSDGDRQIAVAYGAADSAADRSARRVGVVIDPNGVVVQWHAKVSSLTWPRDALAVVTTPR